MSDRLLKATEASGLLGVHVMYLYTLVHQGKIPFVRIGTRQMRFVESDLRKWIASKKEKRPGSCLKKEEKT